MNTQCPQSADGTRIAYDRWGAGPAIVLVHGGGSWRQEWQEAGYIQRLQDSFTVITLDLRGHGESGRPTDPAAYTHLKMCEDILAVADACGVARFVLWGMSYGGKVSRYLAADSDRVARLILISTQLGRGVSGQLRQDAVDFCAHWPPIVQGLGRGSMEITKLSQADQDFLTNFNVPVMLGWVQAMLDWPAIEPADFLCPTLWLVGSDDHHALSSLKEYERSLPGSNVEVQILEGLGHEEVFSEIDTVFPTMLAFSSL